MKHVFSAITLTTVAIAESTIGKDSIIRHFPSCSTGCLVYNLKTAGCTNLNQYCLCTRTATIMLGAIPCVHESCKPKDQLGFDAALLEACGSTDESSDATGGSWDKWIVPTIGKIIPIANDPFSGEKRMALKPTTIPSAPSEAYKPSGYSGSLITFTIPDTSLTISTPHPAPTLEPTPSMEPSKPIISCAIPTLSSGLGLPEPNPTVLTSIMIQSSALGPLISLVTSQMSSASNAPATTPLYNSSAVSFTLRPPACTTTTSLPDYTAAAAVRRPAAVLGMFGIIALLL